MLSNKTLIKEGPAIWFLGWGHNLNNHAHRLQCILAYNYIQFMNVFFLKPVKLQGINHSITGQDYIYIYRLDKCRLKRACFLPPFVGQRCRLLQKKQLTKNRTPNASTKAAKAGSLNWVAASKRDPIKKYINIDEIKSTMALKHDPARNRTHREGT